MHNLCGKFELYVLFCHTQMGSEYNNLVILISDHN